MEALSTIAHSATFQKGPNAVQGTLVWTDASNSAIATVAERHSMDYISSFSGKKIPAECIHLAELLAIDLATELNQGKKLHIL